MKPDPAFRGRSPEFWALVKLVSQTLGYSTRKTPSRPGAIKVYAAEDVRRALGIRGLDPDASGDDVSAVSEYSETRAQLLEGIAPLLMDRDQARALYEEIVVRVARLYPPDNLIAWNKQSGEKRHPAYLTSMVNLLTYEQLAPRSLSFNHNPRGPLTFASGGRPLRTLFRWMDGAFPDVNHPEAAWEIKEYYGTTTFGSRVADGVYETALDGYELNDLRDVGVEVKHYLFLDDRHTWWHLGKSYLCRIVDMLHADLLDEAFFGREVVDAWPLIVAAWE